MIKGGTPADMERMMARMDAEATRPFDDPAFAPADIFVPHF